MLVLHFGTHLRHQSARGPLLRQRTSRLALIQTAPPDDRELRLTPQSARPTALTQLRHGEQLPHLRLVACDSEDDGADAGASRHAREVVWSSLAAAIELAPRADA